MTYIKNIWQDDVTDLDATNMNHIEDGIESVDQELSDKANSSDLEGHLVNVAPSVDEDYRVNLLKGKNLFDINSAKRGYEITSDSSGNIGTNSSWFVTDYIKVTEGKQYYASNFTSSLKCFYDSGKNFIISSRNNPVTVPTNAKYLVMNGTISSLSDDLQIELGETATTYEPFVQKSIQVDGTKFTDTLNVGTSVDTSYKVNVLYSKNLFDINNINLRTGYILNDSGTEISDNTGGYTRNYSEVNANTEYILSGLQIGNGNRRIYYYDANKNFLSRSSLLGGDVTSYTFTTPANCKYVNFQIHTTIDTNLTIWNLQKTPYVLPSIYVDGDEIYNSNIMNYSTSEKRIGTWIDGKPLYRKVFTITSLTSSNTNLVDVSGLSIDFVKISGTIITSTGAKFPINLYDSASNYSVIIISDVGYIRGRGAIGSGTLSKCIVILEYTKTTDV